MKQCTRCNSIKEYKDFNKRSLAPDRLTNYCKSCISELKVKSWQKVKPNPTARPKTSKNCKNCNCSFFDISRTQTAIVCSKSCKASLYGKRHPAKVNARNAKRYAKKILASPPWLTKEHFKQIEEFYILAQKLEQETGIKHHVDHIMPLQGELLSGLHVPWNLQILTATENIKKSNKI